MCFVTYALDYAQRRRVRREYKRGVLTGKEYPLLPHPSVGSLGYADHGEFGNSQSRQGLHGGVQLPRAPIDEQQVGHGCLALQDACKTTLHGLLDTRVVVARSDAA